MKKCPFCKKEIEVSSIQCPICKMVLIEKIPSKQTSSNYSYQPKNSSTSSEPKKQNYTYYNSPKSSTTKTPFKFPKINGWVISIVGSLLLTFILSYHGSPNPLPSPTSTTTSPENLNPIVMPSDLQTVNYVPATNATPYVPPYSLPNGTVLFSDPSSFSGLGVLSISNGSGSDAVVKLIIDSGTKVFSVYIRSNNSYSIKNITDNTYRLLFEFGSNWDKNQQKFLDSPSAEAFNDTFKFQTTNSQYVEYDITLNPVANGTATTNTIDPSEFDKY